MHRGTQRKRARRARTRLADELQILGRGLAVLVAHGPALDLLPLVQTVAARALDRRDVHERIAAPSG
jgi:hypothetical protein